MVLSLLKFPLWKLKNIIMTTSNQNIYLFATCVNCLSKSSTYSVREMKVICSIWFYN